MRKVIYVGEEPKGEKGVEFTNRLNGERGWTETSIKPCDYEKIVYLGKCSVDGDMFSTYKGNSIDIFKGHLNNGTF